MTGLHRTMGYVVALAALHAPLCAYTPSARALDEVQDTFKQGVEMWERGHEKEALVLFNKVLGMSPSQESAFALWQETDYSVWRELLASGGEAQLVAKRLIELARLQRKAIANNEDAIKALVTEAIGSDDDATRRKAIHTLSANHGEYAAAYLIGFLGTGMSDADKTGRAMATLVRMNTDVVVPLCTALASDDAALRRNLCYVLGTIGDPRAAGYVAWHAQSDADASVKAAAQESLVRAHYSGDALASFLQSGDAYHHRTIREQDYSDVVWRWENNRLTPVPIPHAIFGDEMAKTAYDHALSVSPDSNAALAGLARSYVSEATRLELLEKASVDVGPWKAQVDEARLAVHAAGVPALDTALMWSVQSGDSTVGGALCRVLSSLCKEPCESLNAALASSDGVMRSEASVALATIALRGGTAPSGDIVRLLGEAVGRDVARVAIVIDADAPRGTAVQTALEQLGLYVTRYESGAKALVLMRRAAGVDIVVAADKLTDVTLAEILDEMKADARLVSVPVVAISATPEETAAAYPSLAGTVKDASDLKPVTDAMAKGVTGDRAMADDLAQRAGNALAHLAHGGHVDVSSALPAVQSALTNRPDGVVLPALHTLGQAGTADHVAPILAVLADGTRSEPVRTAAADALADILSRNGTAVSAEGAVTLQTVASSDAPVGVRNAAARALGLVQMDAAQRIELLRKLRGGATPAPAAAGG